MNTTNKINKTVKVLKKKIERDISKKDYEKALELTSICSNVLYYFNQYYQDEELENFVKQISQSFSSEIFEKSNKNTVVFYDGFGFNFRGLVLQYLRALSKCCKLVYVTYKSRENDIPTIKEIVTSGDGEIVYLEKETYLDKIIELDGVVLKYKPEHFFVYSYPNDVVVVAALNLQSQSNMKKHLINLTDHAFWLGTSVIDYCIEFRDYGAYVSNKYRKIDRQKLLMLPYYPNISQKDFKGYPFEFDEKNQKLIFSGGSLYKTIGKENLFYKIVEHILEKYDNTVFWYAGSGDDSQMKKLIEKFPQRAYLTAERDDFLEIIKRSCFYLNSYPVSGGLMMQYAAVMGKPPISLKHNDDISGILIGQENLEIVFDDLDELYKKIDELLQQKLSEKYANELKKSVISETEFNAQVKQFLKELKTDYSIDFNKTFDDEKLRKTYVERFDYDEFCDVLVTKKTLKTMLTIFPKECLHKVFASIKRKLFKK